MLTSYAQNFEDVILWRALKHVEKGFYIDIGAQDPVVDSVSRAFYEKGWRGVHVEPMPYYAQKLREARPDETVVQAAVGMRRESMPFYEIPGTGLSTGRHAIAKQHIENRFEVSAIEVETIPLSALLDQYKDKEIHWLKIDVEGMEAVVIDSWRPSQVRPWIVVVESTLPMTAEYSFDAWEETLLSLDYQFAYFDGLNRFYVGRKHLELLPRFGPGPNVFDQFTLSGSSTALFCARLNEMIEQSRREQEQRATTLSDTASALVEALSRVRRQEEVASAKLTQAQLQAEAANARADNAEKALKALDSALKGSIAAETDARNQISSLSDEIVGLRLWKTSLLNSTSWRITKPIRRIKAISSYILRVPKRIAKNSQQARGGVQNHVGASCDTILAGAYGDETALISQENLPDVSAGARRIYIQLRAARGRIEE